MKIETIYNAINNWKDLIDSFKDGNEKSKELIFTYLNYGSHFSVNEKEIREWSKRLNNQTHQAAIHAYIGIDDDRLKLFLIDSKSDSEADFSYIVTKEFTRQPPSKSIDISKNEIGIDSEISSKTAIYRNFRYNMYGNAWLETQKKNLFRIIHIPFNDYLEMKLGSDESCTSFLGLTNDGLKSDSIADYHIEIISVRNIGINYISRVSEDYSTPRPPFTVNDPESNYQLLMYSDDQL